MGVFASSPRPFVEWTPYEVGLAVARLIDPNNKQCIAFFVLNNLSGKLIVSKPNLAEVSNLLYQCGNDNIVHHRILRLFLTLVRGGLPCEHPFIEKKESSSEISSSECSQYECYCLDCKSILKTMNNSICTNEEREGLNQPSLINEFIGVSIAWLVKWTNENHCWHLPTWVVRRIFVVPHTSTKRCRYVDLIGATGHESSDAQPQSYSMIENVTGKPHTYVCHKWCDNWGNLVRAVSRSTSDWSRKVYIDIFCVDPPWLPNDPMIHVSCPSPPVAFDAVRQCEAFLLVCSSLHQVAMNPLLSEKLSSDQKEQLTSLRFWNGLSGQSGPS